MDVEALKASLVDNPNDPRPLNQALKDIIADPAAEFALESFDAILDFLFEPDSEFAPLQRTLDARLRAVKGTSDEERLMLLEVANRYWKDLEDLERAEPVFRKLKDVPGYGETVRDFYIEFYLSRSNWRRIEELVFKAHDTNSDAADAHHVYRELAHLAHERGDSIRESQFLDKTYKSGFADSGEVDRLLELNRMAGKWHLVAGMLSTRVGSMDDLDSMRETYRELVRIYTDEMGVEAKALNIYTEWRERDSENQELTQQLLDLYGRLGRWPQYVKLLAQLAEQDAPPEEQKERWAKLGGIYLERLRNIPEAIRSYENAREFDPDDSELTEQLKSLYRERRAFDKYIALSREELAGVEEHDDRLAQMVALAQLGEKEITRPDQVIPLWEAVLAEDLSNAEAQDALSKLYERTQQFDRLVALLADRAELEEDSEQKTAIFEKIAVTAQIRLKDPDRAVQAWHKVLDAEPSHMRAFAEVRKHQIQTGNWEGLEHIFRQQKKLDELTRVLESQVRKAETEDRKVGLLKTLIRLYTEDIKDLPRASRALQQLHDIRPDDPMVLKDLAQLARESGDIRRLETALKTLAPLLDSAQERKQIYLELADLAEGRQMKPKAAFEHTVAALKEVPRDLELVERIGALAERSGNEKNYLDVLEGIFPVLSTDDDYAIPVALAVARGAKGNASEMERSVRFYGEVLGRDPRHVESLEALLNDSERREDLDEQISFLQRLTDVLPVEQGVDRMAQVADLQATVGDLNGAEGTLQTALDLAPDRVNLYGSLEQLYLEQEEYEQALDVVGRLKENLGETLPADMLADVHVRFALAKRLSGGEPSDLAPALLDALALVPDHEEATGLLLAHLPEYASNKKVLRGLERSLREQGRDDGLADILELQSVLVSENALGKCLGELLGLYQFTLNDPVRVFRTQGRLYRIDPDNHELRGELETSAEATENWSELVKLYRTLAPDVEVETRRTLLIRTSEVEAEYLGDAKAAAAALEAVVSDNSNDAEVLRSLANIYRREDDYEELASTLRRLLEIEEEDDARRGYLELSQVLHRGLERPEEALDVLKETRERWPENVDVLTAMRGLLLDLDESGDAEEVVRALAGCLEGDERHRYLVEAGRLAYGRLSQYGDALERVREVFAENSTHQGAVELAEAVFGTQDDFKLEAAKLLAPALRELDEPERLIPALEVLEDNEGDSTRKSELHLELADIYLGPVEDDEMAELHLRAAVSQVPADAILRHRLVELSRMRGELRQHVQFLEGLVEEDGSVPVQISLLQEAAGILVDDLEDVEGALARHARIVQDIEPGESVSMDFLLNQNERLERYPKFLDWVDSALEVRQDVDARRSLYLRAVKAAQSAPDIDRALSYFEAAELDFPSDLGFRRDHVTTARDGGRNEALSASLAGLIQCTDDADERARARVERARLLSAEEGCEDEAILQIREHLDERADDRPAWELLVDLQGRVEAHDDLVESLQVLRGMLDETETEATVEMGLRIARIYANNLEQHEVSIGWYRKVAQAQPEHERALSDIETLLDNDVCSGDAYSILDEAYEHAERNEDRVRIRELRAGQVDDENERVALFGEASTMAEDKLDDSSRALNCLMEVMALRPDDAGVRSRCLGLADSANQHSEFADKLLGVSEEVMDAALRAELLRERAALLLGSIDDLEGALEALNQALEVHPTDIAAQQKLDDLYLEHGRHESLSELLDFRATHTEESALKTEYLLRRADILSDSLDDADEATMVLLGLLAEGGEPGGEPTVSRLRSLFDLGKCGDEIFPALDRVYVAAESNGALATLLSTRATQIEAGPEKTHILRRLGDVRTHKLEDLEGASEAYAEAWKIDPADAKGKNILKSACEKADAMALYADTLSDAAASSDDEIAQVDWMLEEAVLRRDRLDDRVRAYEIFRETLTIDEDRIEGLNELDTMLTHDELYQDLASVLQTKAGLQEGSPRSETLHRLSGILTGPLEDLSGARRTLEQILDSVPDDLLAHERLEDVLGNLGEHGALAVALGNHAEVVQGTSERADLLARAGKLYEGLEDLDEAAGAYEEALMADPGRLSVMRALQNIARDREDWDRLVEVADQELRVLGESEELDAERCVLLHRELANIRSGQLDDAYGALNHLDKAVALVPDDMEFWRMMLQLASEVDKSEDQARALEALLASDMTTSDERTKYLHTLAILRTEVLPDAARAIEVWADYLDRVSSDKEGHETYLELLERERKYRELVEHLGKLSDLSEVDLSAEERVGLKHRQAEVLLQDLMQPDEAAEHLEGLLQVERGHEDGWDLLERIYREKEDKAPLADFLGRRVSVLDDDGDAVAMLREVANLYARDLGDHAAALDALVKAFRRDPEDTTLLEAAHAEAKAVENFDSILDAGRETLERIDEDMLEERICELASIAADDAHNAEVAIGFLEYGLEKVGATVSLLLNLPTLLEKVGRMESMVEALAGLFDVQEDSTQKLQVGRKLAGVLEERLEDYDGAVRVYEAMVEVESTDAATLESLDSLYRKLDRPLDIIRNCERMIDVQPERSIELLKRIGALYFERLEQPRDAADAYEQALSTDPRNDELYELLEATYGTIEDWDVLSDLYERWSMAHSDPVQRAEICKKQGILQEEARGDLEAAADAYGQALNANTEDEEALDAIVRIYRKTSQLEEVVYIYRDIVQRSSDMGRKAQLLWRSAKLHAEDLSSPEDAVQVLEELLKLVPDDKEALEYFLVLNETLDRAPEAVGFLRQQLESITKTEVREISAVALAKILYTEMGDAEGGLAALDGLEDDAAEGGVLMVRADLYEALGRDDELELALTKRIESLSQSPERADALCRLAELRERHGDYEAGTTLYEQALSDKGNHARALRRLANLFLKRDMPVEAEPLLGVLAEELSASDASEAERADVAVLLGETAQQLLDHEGALEYFRQAVALQSENLELRVRVGELAHRAGNSELASEHLGFALERLDELSQTALKAVHKIMGELALESGRYEDAHDHFLEVVAVDPRDSQVIEEVVELSLRYDDFAGALEHMRTVVNLKEQPLEKYHTLLRMAETARDKLDDLMQAEDLLGEAIAIHPESEVARIELLKIYNADGRFTDAVRVLEDLVEVEEDLDAKADYLTSAAQLALDQLDDALRAVDLLNTLLDLDPSRVDAFARIDKMLTQSKDWKAQELNYRRMLERVKGKEGSEEIEFRLYTGLGEIYRSRLGDMQYAADAFELACKIRGDHVPTLEILADLYPRLGDKERAMLVLRDLARLEPGHLEGLSDLFVLSQELGDAEMSRVASQILMVLNRATTETRAHYENTTRPMMVRAEAQLDLVSWQRCLIPGNDSALVGEIFSILYRVLASSLEIRDLKSIGLKRKDEIDPEGKEVLASVFKRSRDLLGLGPVRVYRNAGGSGIQVESTTPPCVVIGEDMLAGKTEAELAFYVGKHLTLLMPMHALAALYGPGHLEALALAAELYLNPEMSLPPELESIRPTTKAIAEEINPSDADRLRRLMPLLRDRAHTGIVQHYINDIERTAVRAGLLLADDLGVAAQLIQAGSGTVLGDAPAGEQVRDLVRWMLSDAYLEARNAIAAS